MAQVTAARWCVEEYFEESKGELGMSDYEARGWPSWHHHMSLVPSLICTSLSHVAI